MRPELLTARYDSWWRASSTSAQSKPSGDMASSRGSTHRDTASSRLISQRSNPFLKARLADVVWLLGQPKDPKFAHAAIDAYLAFPISTETWHRNETGKALGRASRLAGMLKARVRVDAIQSHVLSAFDKTPTSDGFLPASKEAGRIAARLDALATEFAVAGNDHHAMEYSDAAAAHRTFSPTALAARES